MIFAVPFQKQAKKKKKRLIQRMLYIVSEIPVMIIDVMMITMKKKMMVKIAAVVVAIQEDVLKTFAIKITKIRLIRELLFQSRTVNSSNIEISNFHDVSISTNEYFGSFID